MADKDSAQITNAVANPRVLQEAKYDGIVRMTYGEMTTDVIHIDAEQLRFCQVYSTWLCVGWRVVSADISSTSDMHLGLFREDGGAVLDLDCFSATASLVDIATDQDSGFLAAALPANVGKISTFFELAGSPSGLEDAWYDVCGTIETANTTIADLIGAHIFYMMPGN